MASMRSRCFVSFASLLISSILCVQRDYDEFVLRWPLEHDLSCIHTKVEDIGTELASKGGEPNWEGRRTYCFFLQQIVSVAFIREWPSSDGNQIALAFVKKPTGIPISTEGEKIEDCETSSNIEDTQGPSWLKSPDLRVVLRGLRKHCFYKNEEIVANENPVKVMIKVKYNSRTGLYEPRVVHFVVADDPSYFIVDDEDDVNEVCTRCNAGGGFSQSITITGSNLTSFLETVKPNLSRFVKSTVKSGS